MEFQFKSVKKGNTMRNSSPTQQLERKLEQCQKELEREREWRIHVMESLMEVEEKRKSAVKRASVLQLRNNYLEKKVKDNGEGL